MFFAVLAYAWLTRRVAKAAEASLARSRPWMWLKHFDLLSNKVTFPVTNGGDAVGTDVHLEVTFEVPAGAAVTRETHRWEIGACFPGEDWEAFRYFDEDSPLIAAFKNHQTISILGKITDGPGDYETSFRSDSSAEEGQQWALMTVSAR